MAFACLGPGAMYEAGVSVSDASGHPVVARGTLHRWIDSPRLPAHRAGRLRKWKLWEVDASVERGSDPDAASHPPTVGRR